MRKRIPMKQSKRCSTLACYILINGKPTEATLEEYLKWKSWNDGTRNLILKETHFGLHHGKIVTEFMAPIAPARSFVNFYSTTLISPTQNPTVELDQPNMVRSFKMEHFTTDEALKSHDELVKIFCEVWN